MSDNLHAYKISKDDAAFIQMFKGATFSHDTKIVMPSGKTIMGSELMKYLESK